MRMQGWRTYEKRRWTGEERESPSCLSWLPDELLVRIFECMSTRELANAREVCLRWNAVITADLEKGIWLKQRGAYHLQQRARKEEDLLRRIRQRREEPTPYPCLVAALFALFPFPLFPARMAFFDPINFGRHHQEEEDTFPVPRLPFIEDRWSPGWTAVGGVMCVACPILCPCYWCMFYALFRCTNF